MNTNTTLADMYWSLFRTYKARGHMALAAHYRAMALSTR